MPSSHGPPLLHIDTSAANFGSKLTTGSIKETPSVKTRARALSQTAWPSLLISSSSQNDVPLPSPALSPAKAAAFASNSSSRARDESQKLLAHLLDQLRNRPKAPSVDVSNQHASAPGARRGRSRSNNLGLQSDSDSDDELEAGYSTNVTFDLMNQLKDVLTISLAQGWQIFHEGSFSRQSSTREENTSRMSSSPFRRRRRGSRSNDARSRSPSPEGNPSHAPELLLQCISILQSVVSEDCRFQMSSPRLLRPPNALQAVTLDVAQLLVHMHNHTPAVLSHVGLACLPAFATFQLSMRTRLLRFYEEGILREMLCQARQILGLAEERNVFDGDASLDHPNIQPVVSIQVEEAGEERSSAHAGWRPWLTAATGVEQRVSSSNAPGHSTSSYHLSSLVAPLLAAILESTDFSSDGLPSLHRFFRLFEMIIDLKPDAYLDVLQIVAYHTPKARHAALSLLGTFWPRALGHVIVGQAHPHFSYAEAVQASNGRGTKAHHPWNHSYAHQFVPWRFLQPSMPALFDGISHRDCQSCANPINGFGLFCPFCMCAVHFDCYDYPDGNSLGPYAPDLDVNTQKVAVYRYCYVLSTRRSSENEVVRRQNHSFRLVNLFTLALCFICQEPLWGCSSQALKCDTCAHFVHPKCVSPDHAEIPVCSSSPLTSDCIIASWSVLRDSFSVHYRDFFLSEADIRQRSYEEISILSDALWTQLQILKNGLALGSVVIKNDFAADGRDDDDDVIPEFELHDLVRLYEDVSSSVGIQPSETLGDYLQENRINASQHTILYDWSTLTFITSSIKTAHDHLKPSASNSSDLLFAEPVTTGSDDVQPHPFEVLSLAHLRDSLGIGFQVYSDTAARVLLSHLHHTGFYERLDLRMQLFDEASKPQTTFCVFPLPVGLDMSVDVETLVAAVEASLSDIDLLVNESGFLLLTRRFWPNAMATSYGLRRLTRALLSWIFAEDDSLAAILREYIAHRQTLPGVRLGVDTQPWPSSGSRSAQGRAGNNGGDYVAHRRNLSSKYAAKWMLALHDQDPAFYSTVLYELITEITDDETSHRDIRLDPQPEKTDLRANALFADAALRRIIRLCQVGLVFTAFDDLFLNWLESTSSLWNSFEAVTSLSRLFNSEGESSQRSTTFLDSIKTVVDSSALRSLDPWGLVVRCASSQADGVQRGLWWLRMFARSAVDIPIATVQQFASLANRHKLSLIECLPLTATALYLTWLRSLGRQELLAVVCSLHVRLASDVVESTITSQSLPDIYLSNSVSFLRQSVATILLLAGCERQSLITNGLVLENEVTDLTPRRRGNTRATMVSDPVHLRPEFVSILGRYVDTRVEDIAILVAKFLRLFVSECRLLESYEVDNFILRNCAVLCSCIWAFYGLQRYELTDIRPILFLRVLSVDSQPFESILKESLQPSVSWERRLQAIRRLFAMILDVTSHKFDVDDRQWRSSITSVFDRFFTSMWQDPQEEIRIAVDAWSQTLLPAHFDAISACWNECLAKAPIADRVKLLAFLIKLQPHFPSWQLLSWEGVVETLLEDDYLQKHGENADGPAAAHLSMYGLSSRDSVIEAAAEDSDTVALRVSLLLLSMKMIVSGIPIDVYNLLKIKMHLVDTLGFEDATNMPSSSGITFHISFQKLVFIPGYSYPCISELFFVLDASHPLTLAPSAMRVVSATDEGSSTLLIGSVFVDVVLTLWNVSEDILSLPFLCIKHLLEALVVVIYKHDMESPPLKHLQGSLRRAVRKVMDVALKKVSYEIRQLALSVAQAYAKRWPSAAGGFVVDSIETLSQLLSDLAYNREDVLASQALSVLENSLSTFAENGILTALCKRPRSTTFFDTLRHVTETGTLRETLLRDALLRLGDNDIDSIQTIIDNLNMYVEVVYRDGYSVDLLQHAGLSLTIVVRRTAECNPETFDPSPILLFVCTLLENHKHYNHELLSSLEMILRATLIRFHISRQSLVRLLEVVQTVRRKDRRQATGVVHNITLALVEILADGLRRKARIPTVTVGALTDALLEKFFDKSGKAADDFADIAIRLVEDGLFYLQTHTVHAGQVDAEFHASMTVGKLIMFGTQQRTEIIHKALSEQVDKTARYPFSVRAWNILLLCALQTKSNDPGAVLLSHFSTFVQTFCDTLTPPSRSAGLTSVSVAADINSGYTGIKLWLLLERKLSSAAEGDPFESSAKPSNVGPFMIWNELWPSFQNLTGMYGLDVQGSQNSPLASLTSASIADLFLFLRQCHSPIALETALQAEMLNRLRLSGRPETQNSKVVRALRNLSEPLSDVPWDELVDQAASDILAAEKLQALETMRRDARSHQPGGYRRDSRVVS